MAGPRRAQEYDAGKSGSFNNFTDVDGSLLEGGGQVLRIAIALSAIKKVPVRIFNIRAGRSKPGLGEQHLKGLLLVRDMCGGQLKGAEIGSQEILFTPGPIQSGHFEARECGSVDASLCSRCLVCSWQIGFFPRGGGEVRLQVNNLQTGLNPVTLLEPGEVSSIQGVAVAHEMKKGAETVLLEHFGKLAQPNVKVQQGPADCPGSSIMVVAHTSTGCILGASAIGNRKKQPYDIGVQAANDLVAANPGQLCLDLHAQDQVILPMALSSGTSQVLTGPVTLHTRTAIAVVQMFCKDMQSALPAYWRSVKRRDVRGNELTDVSMVQRMPNVEVLALRQNSK
ncbi:hypothetical protein B566_EDAN011780 [Ephemera danica]|nr:hypothetical protein B566_EDAN011780 [Ephemera danica]